MTRTARSTVRSTRTRSRSRREMVPLAVTTTGLASGDSLSRQLSCHPPRVIGSCPLEGIPFHPISRLCQLLTKHFDFNTKLRFKPFSWRYLHITEEVVFVGAVGLGTGVTVENGRLVVDEGSVLEVTGGEVVDVPIRKLSPSNRRTLDGSAVGLGTGLTVETGPLVVDEGSVLVVTGEEVVNVVLGVLEGMVVVDSNKILLHQGGIKEPQHQIETTTVLEFGKLGPSNRRSLDGSAVGLGTGLTVETGPLVVDEGSVLVVTGGEVVDVVVVEVLEGVVVVFKL
ncbi:Protein of unknown function [Gryllus bimaculatus]|nr:Protein of unknown function [Gryllus bimaculatus]